MRLGMSRRLSELIRAHVQSGTVYVFASFRGGTVPSLSDAPFLGPAIMAAASASGSLWAYSPASTITNNPGRDVSLTVYELFYGQLVSRLACDPSTSCYIRLITCTPGSSYRTEVDEDGNPEEKIL